MKLEIFFLLLQLVLHFFSYFTKGCSFFYSEMLNYKKMNLLGDTFEYEYWQYPNMTLKNAEEEAIMLIGGKYRNQIIYNLIYYLAYVIEQPNFRIPNPQYLQRISFFA